MSRCTSCGFELSPTQKVCPACGKVVAAVAATGSGAAGVVAKQTEQNVSVFMKYADLLDNEQLYNAALCKLNGIGIAKNFHEAMEMFKILAFRGYADGMYKYAECLLNDNQPDQETACRWLSQAASEGHKPSRLLLNNLGYAFKAAPVQGRISQVSGLEALVAEALPSILSIEVITQNNGQKMRSAGSGFIIEGGYVITNAHVIGDNPVYVVARFEPGVDQTSYNLMPIAIAPSMDIAVLRFSGLADSKFTAQRNLELRVDQLAFGEDVYTIGNPLGIGLSVSKGVISSPNRQSNYPPAVKEVIQTDITANHGNSGGALLDMNNSVLGMITFTPSRSEGGMAMCVPSSRIVEVLNKTNEIIKRGK